MTTFDDRERAHEAKFIHDSDMRFRVEARRNRILGIWAAELLGKSGAEADDYIAGVIRSDFIEAGDEDVLRKLAADLNGLLDSAAIRARMDAAFVQARAEIAAER